MKQVVKIFGEAVLVVIAFMLTMYFVMYTEDEKGHVGIMQVTGHHMADWKDDEGTGFDTYLQQSEKLLPETQFTHQKIKTGIYSIDQLITVKNNAEEDITIILKKVTTPERIERLYPVDATDIAFDTAGIYTIDFEVRDADRRVSQRQIKIPVNK